MKPSCEDAFDDVAFHAGEPLVKAVEAEGEALVIKAERVQDRGVQVVDVDLVLSGTQAEIVGGAVHMAMLHAGAEEHV